MRASNAKYTSFSTGPLMLKVRRRWGRCPQPFIVPTSPPRPTKTNVRQSGKPTRRAPVTGLQIAAEVGRPNRPLGHIGAAPLSLAAEHRPVVVAVLPLLVVHDLADQELLSHLARV